jgi:hypothetical protein
MCQFHIHQYSCPYLIVLVRAFSGATSISQLRDVPSQLPLCAAQSRQEASPHYTTPWRSPVQRQAHALESRFCRRL